MLMVVSLIPLSMLVAAWLGFSALAGAEVKNDRLIAAFAVLAMPCMFVLMMALPQLLTTGRAGLLLDPAVFIMSLVVAVAIGGGWLVRRSGLWQRSAPSPEYLALTAARHDHAPIAPPPARSTGTIADLHCPAARVTVPTVMLLTLIGYSSLNQRSGGHFAIFSADDVHIGGLIVFSTITIIGAIVFAFYPSPGTAVLYSGLTLIVTAGALSLLLGWLQRSRYLTGYDYMGVALGMSAVAIAPALIGQIIKLWQRFRDR